MESQPINPARLQAVLLYPAATYHFGRAHHLRGKIEAIDLASGILSIIAEGEGVGYSYAHVNDVLPELFGFSALCTPLADGTIPAVEVAKLACFVPAEFDQPAIEWDRVCAEIDEDERGEEFVVLGHESPHGDMERHFLYIYTDFSIFWHDSQTGKQVQCVDYLRSLHFALPVGGKPLVEGIDYIRKEA